ncbi:MAG TPA: HEAT repeat domain-containing protein [Pyrinomonadaceae bacterium]|nr:HEAT repeat domain-containing protein [Pyrinomonadaceae bacterium]
MKIPNLLQTLSRTRWILVPSLMVLSALSNGCSSNNGAPSTANGPMAASVWKLAPGDQLVYRLKYTSNSFTDLQAMYGSVAVAGQRKARTGSPRLFKVTVEATVVMTTIQRNGSSTIANYRFTNSQINVESDMGAMINTNLIQAELGHPTVCQIDAEGRIRSLLFDSNQSAATQNFSRSLLGLMQFARPEKADANEWQLDEDDPSGEYRAQYNALPAARQETAAPERSHTASFRKTKLQYFPHDVDEDSELPQAPKTIVPEAAFDVTFDFGKGRIESLSGVESQTVFIADKVVGGARNEIQLALLSEAKAPATELASAVADYLKRSRTRSAIALSASPSEQAQLTTIYRAQLADDSLVTIKAELDAAERGDSEIDSSKLYSKVKALIFLQPETCLELGAMLQSSDPNGATLQLIAGALGAVGHGEAQQTLVEALRKRRHDEAVANALITAIGATKKPTQAAQAAVEEIAWDIPETTTVRMAQLQLGAIAHSLKKRSPERAAGIVERAVKTFSSRAGTEHQLITFLGNSGVGSALPILSKFLDDPSADLRGHAALALRRIKGEQADVMLARALTDANESVRIQAATALEFRNITQTNFHAQKEVLLSDKSDSVRGRVMKNLWRSHEAYPEVVALMKELAAKDSSKEVRRAANGLLADL